MKNSGLRVGSCTIRELPLVVKDQIHHEIQASGWVLRGRSERALKVRYRFRIVAPSVRIERKPTIRVMVQVAKFGRGAKQWISEPTPSRFCGA